MNINAVNEPICSKRWRRWGWTRWRHPRLRTRYWIGWIATGRRVWAERRSDYYQGLNPAYHAKNGPIDDISDLLLVQGVTPELFWGAANTNHPLAAFQARGLGGKANREPATYPSAWWMCLRRLPPAKSTSTRPRPTVLQMVLIDPNAAAEIIQLRSGFDGMEGTEDDTPIGNVLDALVSAGLSNQAAQQTARFFDVRSTTFEVQVDAEISGYKRHFVALLGRSADKRDVQVLSFSSQ